MRTMSVGAIETPLLLISAPPDGKRRVWISLESGSTSMQLRQVVRGHARELEVIDSSGHYYSRVDGIRSGIAWRVYLHGGPFGLVALLFSLLFATVLVRVRLDFKVPGSPMPLKEIKMKVREAIQANPGIYTQAPVKTIIGRINAAKDVRSLIDGISRD